MDRSIPGTPTPDHAAFETRSATEGAKERGRVGGCSLSYAALLFVVSDFRVAGEFAETRLCPGSAFRSRLQFRQPLAVAYQSALKKPGGLLGSRGASTDGS